MLAQNAGPAEPEAESPGAATENRRESAGGMTDDSAMKRTEKIRAMAYSFYEARGGQDGSALDDWLKAEASFVETSERAEQLPPSI